MFTDEIIQISLVKNRIGSYEKIADLVFENQLEVCFKFDGYCAFLTYIEGFNGTVHDITATQKIFVAEHNKTNIYQVISGTENLYTTSVAKESLNYQKVIPPQEYEITRGWVFLKSDINTISRLQYLIEKLGNICHITLFSEFEVEMYELKLKRENLFITSKSLNNFLKKSTKEKKSPSGITAEKAKANRRILEIAELSWKYESENLSNRTKLLPMARSIRRYLQLHEHNIYIQTTSDEAVKDLIRSVAPKYSMIGGPPTNHKVKLITDNPT